MDPQNVHRFLAAFETEVDEPLADVEMVGRGDLPSVFAVTDFATAAVACAGRAANRVHRRLGGSSEGIMVDARLASLWFRWSIAPDGWQPAPVWDSIAGDYRATDAWVRLHTNSPHHREAALAVLGCRAEPDVVAAVIATWSAVELETEIVAAGGCAAAMRSEAGWLSEPQGSAVAAEPMVHREPGSNATIGGRHFDESRPLAGVRVLDLTRVLAGPIATRFLAGLGADVLRIDPPGWNEPAVVPEVTLGKRCGRLDLRIAEDLAVLRRLLTRADMIIHGYRPGALDALGLSSAERRKLAPGLIDVSLDAYGWTGPWRGRRGFDSLVQMSVGIANSGMERTGADRPKPLPAQALDHATGYLMAAYALHGWCDRLATGRGLTARLSLARTAAALIAGPRTDPDTELARSTRADHDDEIEQTTWGPARRLLPPLQLRGAPLRWDLPATDLGTEPPPLEWRGSLDA